MLKTLPSNLTRGDSGRFRKCLHAAGFNQLAGDKQYPRSVGSIFSDALKDGRRLKLWFARSVFDAPQNKQQHLNQLLQKEFGKRFRSAKFIRGCYWRLESRSLVVYLSK